jgi:hypothetical protein
MPQVTYCTTEKCFRETSLYLCTECIVELDALLKDVPVLIPLLDGARAGTAVARKPGGGGGNQPGSCPPGNLDAMMLQSWLSYLPDRAHTAAMNDPQAGQKLYMARIWVPHARYLVWGPEEETVNHTALRERVRNIAPPMPTRELLPWLRTHAKIAITSMDIRNWARRGKLRPHTIHPQPTYHPHEVLNAWHDTRPQK